MRDFAAIIQELKESHLYRQCRVRQASLQICPLIDGKTYLSFTTNNYLGLAEHPAVIKACQDSAQCYGVGSGAANLLGGYTAEHYALEKELADFIGYPAVLLFGSGYMANVGVLAAMINKRDCVLLDHECHASLLDGARLSGATVVRYRHMDYEHLENKLKQVKNAKNIWLVSDAVFSASGGVIDLHTLVQLANRYHAYLLIDDAHGIGVQGQQGRGSIYAASLDYQQIPICIATLSKAIGVSGAFVAAEKITIDYLVQRARTNFFTTALPPSIAAAARASLQLLQAEEWRRQRLTMLIACWHDCAQHYGLPVAPSTTPIQMLSLPSLALALTIQKQLYERGILVSVLRPPTVCLKQVGLRITLTVLHSQEQIKYLLKILTEFYHASLSVG